MASVPVIPGCITWGDSVGKTIELAKDAIESCLSVMEEERIEIIDDNGTLEYSVQIDVELVAA